MPKHKILIVDDEVDLLEVLEFELTTRGFEVIKASNGGKARECILSENPDFIISDIRMPEGSGFELVQFVSQLPNKIPFVFLTGFSSENDETIPGLLKTFAKPVNYDELVECIISTIEKRDES